MKKEIETDYKIEFRTAPTVDSTINYLRNIPLPDGTDMLVAVTDFQTAGRGQGTNKWESEKGKNILFSFKTRPDGIKATDQFLLQQAVSLGIRNGVGNMLDGCTVKWPNDIYVGDKKLSGTLSECKIRNGMVCEFMAGIGINVNQIEFVSDAPNPVSMANILGKELDKNKVLSEILENICRNIIILNNNEYNYIREAYQDHLYRRKGIHTYEDKDGKFDATFEDILPNGHLVLRRTDGSLSEYEFKEVKYII